ncbi:MAG: hypothetical protein AB7S77_15570, partial [Desulfatirhabdiaceae bacterium]
YNENRVKGLQVIVKIGCIPYYCISIIAMMDQDQYDCMRQQNITKIITERIMTVTKNERLTGCHSSV